jgi:hypothetical protein
VIINLDSVPEAALIGADALAWIVLAAALGTILPRNQRWRILPAIIIGIVLLQGVAAVQGKHIRTIDLMSFIPASSLAIVIFSMRQRFLEYIDVQNRFGDGSPEAYKVARPLAYVSIGIILAIFALVGLVFKNSGL